MKLLLCPECADVRKLGMRKTYCSCRKSWGKYLKDGLHAIIGGKAIPLGFHNGLLIEAIRNRPESGEGSAFKAFVIPKICDTVREEK